MKKPLRILKNQLVNTILMVALTVPLVLTAVSLEKKPTLSFEGARIQVAKDGSVQLLFDVCVRYAPMTSGVQFDLPYNIDYLVPSDYDTNEALIDYDKNIWQNDADKAFRRTPNLYQVDTDKDGVPDTDVNPFAESSNVVDEVGIRLHLETNGEINPDDENQKGFGMKRVQIGESSRYYNVFDATEKVTLGTLSFRVVDPDLMPEITRRFDGLIDVLYEDNHAKDVPAGKIPGDHDLLIFFWEKASGSGSMPWGIGILEKRTDDYEYLTINDSESGGNRAQAAFTYQFPKTIIKARAAEASLTLNAYQAYTDGTVSDIDAALQRYSPAITVTYSDGSEGNFIMPWGRTGAGIDGLPWKATVATNRNVDPNKVSVDVVTDSTTQVEYDPTASRYKTADKPNQNYLVEKGFCYEEYGEKKTFPVPIAVDLTVTPITLVDVTANDLRKSYILNDDLVDGPEALQDLGALKLPSQARLITDVPAGGNTLTMDIPGWSHLQTYTADTPVRYWPSDNTTTPGTGTGTAMSDLWKDSAADETAGAYLHWPVLDDKGKWTDDEANGAKLGANRAGDYTFQMAVSYGGAPAHFTRTQIQAEYPWLTVPDGTKVADDIEAWPIDNAIRTIVWNEDPGKTADDPKLEDIDSYEVEYIRTEDSAANGQPQFTLRVRKKDDHNILENLMADSVFRIRLPDGTEMAVGYKDDEVDQGGDWFEDKNGSYTATPAAEGGYDNRVFDLTTNPGDPTVNSYGNERESLRRYINLGGWFSVAVKEIEKNTADGTVAKETLWSDFIPVYVPPRDNYYTESKVYNFIGDNAGLFPWPGGISKTVILPPGTYHPVEIVGSAIEHVMDPAGSTTRKVERYGVSTTYDGATGAQPGELNTFTVDPGWTVSAPDTTTVPGHSITTYGKNYFLDSAVYNAFGKVLNLVTDRSFNPIVYQADAYTGTIRVEETVPAEAREGIVLEYVNTNGGESSYNTDGTNVTNVIFETRTEGYTMRQDYVLRLRNIGDVDISGISIDTLTDLKGNSLYDKSLDSNPAGGHFVILKPPASFLPAGESTEFVISYVYDLRSASSTPVDYRDKLFITSNSHNTVPTGSTTAGADYLLDFDAQFQVTNSDIHRVFVQVVPSQGTDLDGNTVPMPLGTANVIIGLVDPSDLTSMNTNAGPTAYPKDVPVYILISPKDEYTMVTVTAHDSTGGNVSIGPYQQPDGVLPDGRLVYAFVMPDYDTTVTVTFNEPPRSKLRLSDLRVYADADRYHADGDPSHTKDTDPGCLYPYNVDWNDKDSVKYKSHYQQRVWQKDFTDAEKSTASTYTTDDGEELYLMTKGRANAPDFDSQINQYLVVLPVDADWSQVEVDLRAVQYIFNQADDPIQNLPLENVVVQMTLYDTDNVNDMLTRANAHDIYPQTYTYNNGTTNVTMNPYAQPGATNGPTTHTSIPFLSPEPGSSKYVRVQLSYTEDQVTTSRAYYIELHRATKSVEATLNYGNSPYGMIMNDPAITAKTGAKSAFVNNNYTFAGLNNTLIPSVVRDNGLTDLHYWLETWTSPTETWTAPNADWRTTNAVYDPDTGMSAALYYRLSGWQYDSDTEQDVVNTASNAYNLDLNDYAFFAIMGEAFRDPGLARALDSSGREVDLNKAVLSLEAYTLDSTANKMTPDGQLTRFGLPTDADGLAARTVTIGFLDGTDNTVAVSGDTVKTDWATWYVTSDQKLTQDPAGNTLVELRPGWYKLSYTFPDYNYIPADPANGVAEEGDHLTVTRDFVVLAPVGDVNADLNVTTGSTSDESIMEGRISPDAGYPALGYMTYQDDAIFKLRTCDVNNDRNINNIDSNTIKEGTNVTRFYLPVNYIPVVGP